MLKIRVVSLHGQSPTLKESISRWAFRLIDIAFCFGGVAFLSILSSEKNQRLGDVLANTTVIDTKQNHQRQLHEILKLDKPNFTPKYTNLSNFTDEEMLLVKSVLSRYNTYKSPENEKNVVMMAKAIAQQLDVNPKSIAAVPFLTTVLEEYVLSTR